MNFSKGVLKNKLFNGDTCYGHWVFMPYPEVINIIGKSGFDFIVIDMEHSYTSINQLPSLIDAAVINNMTPLVRIPTSNTTDILRSLDTGAYGIVVPHCDTKEQLTQIIIDSKYFPDGMRGMAKSTKSGEYTNKKFKEYMEFENKNLLNIVCLESKKSIDNLDQLTMFPGVGDKVANCVMLFSLDNLNAFPVDVWINRVLREIYLNDNVNKIPDSKLRRHFQEYFGGYSGYINHYLFHTRRNDD